MSILDVTAFAVVAFRWHVHTFFAFTLLAVFIGLEVIPQRRMIKKISFITMVFGLAVSLQQPAIRHLPMVKFLFNY